MMAGAEPLIWSIAGAESASEVAGFAALSFDPRYREAWTQSQIAALLTPGAGWLELARGEDGAVAAFGFSRQAADEAELLLCATRPATRRQGIGRELVRRVTATALDRGCSRLFLEVRSSNLPAIALYESSGFKIVGRRPGYYLTTDGERIDALTLAMNLR